MSRSLGQTPGRLRWMVFAVSATVATGALIGAGLVGLTPAPRAAAVDTSVTEVASSTVDSSIVKAADLSQFRPGNIISDAVFFNSATMSEAQIQSFLESKVSSCRSGYTCLKDYYVQTRSISADAMCSAYAGGGPERASRVIYKVAQACGINPQVILVMLQKEQGLITSTAPSAWAYQAAMGQGCPDTAACDTAYYGLFNQVYGGARQMKRYANPPGTSNYFTWYAPGKTWNVQYHPNTSCGRGAVFIENQATANLYYYTPYQPNAAALRAGYGEGDGCSSYGNRNFFNYFTDWFGSTQVDASEAAGKAAIVAAYNASGGAGGRLGAVVGDARCGLIGSGCFQNYANGVIYWSPTTGAFSLAEPMRSVWNSLDYERGLGYPASAVKTLDAGATYQDFVSGVIYSSSRGTFAIRGTIRALWNALDYERGLGFPSNAQKKLSDGAVYQDFENGVVYSSSVGTASLSGPARVVWNALDYERGLGYPKGEMRCILANDGCLQDFQRGVIYTSPSGTFALRGAIRELWNSLDYERGLGYPTGSQKSLPDGSTYQNFENGVIYSSKSGTHSITGEARVVWNTLDYERGLGYPASEMRCVLLGDGCLQDFERGAIYSSDAGTFAVRGAIREKWSSLDYERGLGYPTSAQVTLVDAAEYQEFQRGAIYRSASGALSVVLGDMFTEWQNAGGASGEYGYPLAGQTCTDTTCTQSFSGGTLTVVRD